MKKILNRINKFLTILPAIVFGIIILTNITIKDVIAQERVLEDNKVTYLGYKQRSILGLIDLPNCKKKRGAICVIDD